MEGIKLNFIIILTLFGTLMILSGCPTNNNDEQKQSTNDDHFLKEKVDTLNEAKKVEQMLKESTERKRKNLEEQTQ